MKCNPLSSFHEWGNQLQKPKSFFVLGCKHVVKLAFLHGNCLALGASLMWLLEEMQFHVDFIFQPRGCRLVQTLKIGQQLLDDFKRNLVQTFMFTRGWTLLTLVILWLFLWCHCEVKVYWMDWSLAQNFVPFMVSRQCILITLVIPWCFFCTIMRLTFIVFSGCLNKY